MLRVPHPRQRQFVKPSKGFIRNFRRQAFPIGCEKRKEFAFYLAFVKVWGLRSAYGDIGFLAKNLRHGFLVR